MECCPHCGKLLDEDQGSVEQLRSYCRENGLQVFAGDRVSEETAAILLDVTVGTLQNWRSKAKQQGGRLVLDYVRSGSGRGSISYRLSSISEQLRSVEDDF